ncbi:MarR family transcriptional regulator [Paenibacillus sp. IB182496]|uniref:MarR family transcriptional regulator n=1 Tax=Paenibacillus sabuli TaxID=2772509 RepID=A0A927GU81_9BACL|nr:MarR family transcriptional regulator [Paenibacillus sabuli]MBD2848654.1 MarR family transcriptional regulator [Paenibacillus sabuli]
MAKQSEKKRKKKQKRKDREAAAVANADSSPAGEGAEEGTSEATSESTVKGKGERTSKGIGARKDKGKDEGTGNGAGAGEERDSSVEPAAAAGVEGGRARGGESAEPDRTDEAHEALVNEASVHEASAAAADAESDAEAQALDLRLFRVWLRATRALYANVERDIACHGINKEHFMLLELLYSKGAHPVQKISERLDIPSGSITYVVDKLAGKGLVGRRPHPDDRRTSLVELTVAGRELLETVFPEHAKVISRSLSALRPEEKRTLLALMKRAGLAASRVGAHEQARTGANDNEQDNEQEETK